MEGTADKGSDSGMVSMVVPLLELAIGRPLVKRQISQTRIRNEVLREWGCMRVLQGMELAALPGVGAHQGMELVALPRVGAHQGMELAALPGVGAHQGMELAALPGVGAHQGMVVAMSVEVLGELISVTLETETALMVDRVHRVRRVHEGGNSNSISISNGQCLLFLWAGQKMTAGGLWV